MPRTAVARKAPAPPVRRQPPRPAPVKLATPAAPPGGAPLAPQVAAPIAESLGVDVSPVRVHTGPTAATAAAALNARAFALGSSVVLGAGERPTDLGLMAHEVAHAVQQQGAPRVQLWTAGGTDSHEREAQRAAEAVTARRRFSVLGRTRPRVQRLGIGDVLDWFADKAYLIPGYRLFTVIIGVNPINLSRVERSGANILRALVELVPGGNLITRALDNYGVFERAGAFVEQQFRTLGMTGQMFRDALMRFLDSLGWRDLFRPGSVWERAKRIFTEPIGRLIDFGRNLVAGIVRLIKDAILRPLAALASRTRAWDLLCAVLGRNPITGDPVPRTPETLIGGFMKLIGQEEVWRNIQRARAIPRAFAWFQGVLSGLLGFVAQIPRMFLDALRSLTIEDIVLLPSAFAKVGRAFAGFVGRFIGWAFQQVLGLLQIIFEVVAPGAVPYIRKAAGAFQQIIRNPVGFIRNLVRAGIQGFRQFGANFLSHLRRSLIQWLTGTLAGSGIYIPQAFELREIVKFVLSVLGLTWDNLRGKLVRLIPDPVVRALETGFDIVVTLVREGPAAAWDKIRESLSNLREMVMEQIMTFVRDSVVTAAITRLVSSLNPAGAFIQAIIAIYNTVMFFIERLRQIAQVAMSFIDSISAIAAGGIGTAANRVEQTMAGLLTLVISFLARLVGLGRVSDEVAKIVNRIRAPIDRALDRVVAWIVGQARRLGRLVAQAGVPQDPAARLRLASRAAVTAARRLRGRVTGAILQPILGAIRVRYGLRELVPYERGGTWWVRATVNPTDDTDLAVPSSAPAAAPAPSAGATTPAAAWPVEPGNHIRIVETGRIETVLAINATANTITHTVSRKGRVTGNPPSPATRPYASFMREWNAGRITRAGDLPAAQLRAELVRIHGAAVADAIMRRGELAERVRGATAEQAHHIIPIEALTLDTTIQALVNAGWNFNAAINGVPLAEGFHGNHPQYTRYVRESADKWRKTHGPNYTPAFKTFIEQTLIPELLTLIAAAKAAGKTLNQFFAGRSPR
jgi:hypothetical protein